MIYHRAKLNHFMSNNQLNHIYDAQQDEMTYPHQESKQQTINQLIHSNNKPYITSTPNPRNIEPFNPMPSSPTSPGINISNHPESTADKIQLKSRGAHHEVAADNWRIRYYMNLNLVKQPHIHHQHRASSVPHSNNINNFNYYLNDYGDVDTLSHSSQHELSDEHINDNLHSSQQEIAKTEHTINNNNNSINNTKNNHHHLHHLHHNRKKRGKKHTKSINIISRTKSNNNTPPRPVNSTFKRSNHKRQTIGLPTPRLRSRSDGMLSFQVNKARSADSIETIDDDHVHSQHGHAHYDEVEVDHHVHDDIEPEGDEDDTDSINTSDTLFSNLTPPHKPNNKSIIDLTKRSLEQLKLNQPNNNKNYSSRTPPTKTKKFNKYYRAKYDKYKSLTPQRPAYGNKTPPRKHLSDPIVFDHYSSNYTNNNNHNKHNINNVLHKNKSYDQIFNYNYQRTHHPKSSSVSIINRSKPLSIKSNNLKSRFDVDFKPNEESDFIDDNGIHITSSDNLFDDEANFEME